MDKSKIYLLGLAGGYLAYLGVQQFILLLRKEASLPWLNTLAGVLFVIVGSVILVKQWKAYKEATAPVALTEEDGEEEETEGEDEE